MTQEESPLVLIADDGELEDVRGLLEELEIEFLDYWEGKRPASSLLVSTPHRALDPWVASTKMPRSSLGRANRFEVVKLRFLLRRSIWAAERTA